MLPTISPQIVPAAFAALGNIAEVAASFRRNSQASNSKQIDTFSEAQAADAFRPLILHVS